MTATSMPDAPLADVFSADELARAAYVPRTAVDALVEAGELLPVRGSSFFAAADAIRAGRRLRTSAQASLFPLAPVPLFSTLPDIRILTDRRPGLPAFASSFVHAVLLIAILAFTSGHTETASTPPTPDEARLVFLMMPGPGGGGGGGGLRNPLPAPRVERRGIQKTRVAVPAVSPERVLTARRQPEPAPPAPAPIPEPKPIERAPEPLPSQVLIAPVAAAAANARDREGIIENPRGEADSQGQGSDGGAGTGRGTGAGEGLGPGIGEGAGGGTGGGPYRPGSGIEPPRLLREVKAEYTDEARRRNLTGDVLLEIVVRRDGSVGEVTVLQGLGAGLDQRAVSAVREWRFAPARRRGEPVDVIVEVAVEFTLR